MAAGGAEPVGFGRLVSEGAVWPKGVEVLAPLRDQHLADPLCGSTPEHAEYLTIQQLVAELAVEGFDIPRRTAWP
jgi:hypothetical protein